MATLTNEQIEQKKQLLAEKTKQAKALYDELVEAGAIVLPEEELGKASGGLRGQELNIDPIIPTRHTQQDTKYCGPDLGRSPW